MTYFCINCGIVEYTEDKNNNKLCKRCGILVIKTNGDIPAM